MNEKDIIVITICPTCGKEMKVKVGAVNVYCLKCNKWSKVVPVTGEDTDSDNSEMN